jgi:hypothetical protein
MPGNWHIRYLLALVAHGCTFKTWTARDATNDYHKQQHHYEYWWYDSTQKVETHAIDTHDPNGKNGKWMLLIFYVRR